MSENKFETTEGVAKKVWNGVKKKAIKFGDPKETDNDIQITKEWNAEPLPNGALISLLYSQKKTLNKDKKRCNPRYIIALNHKGTKETFSGIYARKIYTSLTKINGIRKTRTNKISNDVSKFCTDALADI